MADFADIHIDWDNEEQTIILVSYGKSWAWEDFRASDAYGRELASSVPHTVHYILDATQAVIPSDFTMNFPELARTAASLNLPNTGLVVLVGLDTTMEILLTVFKRVYPQKSDRLRTARTVEAAYQLVAADQS